jgi:hypothetical protein
MIRPPRPRLAARLPLPAVLLGVLLFLPRAAPASDGLRHRFFLSPPEIRETDTRALAERLVKRLRRECDLAGDPLPGGPLVGGDADIVMMVPAAMLGSIARYGFLNQHQTMTSRGFDLPSDRFFTEESLAMMFLPYDAKGRELLPKYAVLDARRPGFGSFALPTRYGGVAVVFKKEVGRRATWTYADTLDFSRSVGRYGAGGASNPVLPRTLLYSGKRGDRNLCGNYCEAQIWGRLEWRDVDYLMIPKGAAADGLEIPAGVRVYRYAETPASSAARGHAARYERGARVRVRTSARPAGSSPAPEAYLEGRDDAARTDASLVADLEREEAAPSTATARARRLSLLGELAARPKTEAVASELSRAAASPDPAERAEALYGLSELPWPRFKAVLLAGLADSNPRVEAEALAFAGEHQDDGDVASAVDRLKALTKTRALDPRNAEAPVVEEWLERLATARACE